MLNLVRRIAYGWTGRALAGRPVPTLAAENAPAARIRRTPVGGEKRQAATEPAATPVNPLDRMKRERREKLGAALAAEVQADTWGLALSGGGVRSATFCYGLVSALAKRGTFFRFDLMSTVSGGGYIGAMIGRMAARATDARALQTRLAQDGPGCEERDWLRANSRYLLPRGSRDFLFTISTFVRNLAGVHVELGVLGLLLGCMLGTINLLTWWVLDTLIATPGTPYRADLFKFRELVAPWPTLWLFIAVPGCIAALAYLHYWVLMVDGETSEADTKRHRVTGRLAKALRWMLALLVLGGIDWLAWRLANRPDFLMLLGGGFVLLLVLLRALLPQLSTVANAVSTNFLRLPVIIDVAGRFTLLVLALFWVSIAHASVTRKVFNAAVPLVDFSGGALALGAAMAGILGYMLAFGWRVDFLNRSSLHHFYRSRLSRTYLGAANPRRHGAGEHKVTSPEADDDVRFSQYRPHANGGPVHMINVCVNQTVQRTGLFNIDRQGDLMTLVGPDHYHVERQPWRTLPANSPESLGTWVAVSGAAAAPGMGSGTRAGWAALMTTLGIRLGYWWKHAAPTQKKGLLQKVFPKYLHLFDELMGRLPGSAAPTQYLSDGGHSENTGVYPLLEEKCRLILMADCGADPDFRFDDLEHLIRRARIDLGVDIRFFDPPPDLSPVLGTLDEVVSTDASACIAVALIDYGQTNGVRERGVLVLVKPNLTTDLPEDVYNYARDHVCFPQETTADQFFDEEQWESYHALGRHLGLLLTTPLMKGLAALASTPVALAASPHIPAPVPPAKSCVKRRLPPRIGARTATAATIGVGALTTVGALWTAFEQSGITHDDSAVPALQIDALHAAYAKVQLAPADAAAIGINNGAVNSVAAEANKVWRSLSPDQRTSLNDNAELTQILRATSEQCMPLQESHAACKIFLQMINCSGVRRVRTDMDRNYGYWARIAGKPSAAQLGMNIQYFCEAVAAPRLEAMQLADVDSLAAATGPANADDPVGVVIAAAPAVPSTPEVELPACAQPGTGTVCKAITVNVRLYSGDGRDSVRGLRGFWQEAGASVPPFENVSETARRQGRSAPDPYPQPTVYYGREADKTCADSLAQLACQGNRGWKVEKRPGNSELNTPIDVWLPPAFVAKGFDQWAAHRGVCYQEKGSDQQGAFWRLQCFGVSGQCEQARGASPSADKTVCDKVELQKLEPRIPLHGWGGSRYNVQREKPFESPFPQSASKPEVEKK